jgi:hypothetical protein
MRNGAQVLARRPYRCAGPPGVYVYMIATCIGRWKGIRGPVFRDVREIPDSIQDAWASSVTPSHYAHLPKSVRFLPDTFVHLIPAHLRTKALAKRHFNGHSVCMNKPCLIDEVID